MIKIYEPYLSKKEKFFLDDAFDNNEISTFGNYSAKFEKKINTISKSKYTLAVTSASVGLYLSFKSLNVQRDDIILAPSYTFAATINSIIHAGAKPYLFDIAKNTLCLNLDEVEDFLKKETIQIKKNYYYKKNKKKIFAICPVLTFSIVPDLKRINEIAKKYNLKIVLDAACALGSFYNKKSLNKYSDVVVYSFNGNKSFTAGGGGAICSDKFNIYKKAYLLATNAKKINENYKHSFPAHNFKISNIHAAIGYGQLSQYQNIIKKKKLIQKRYENQINFHEKKNVINLLSKFIKSNNPLWINFIILKNKTVVSNLIKNLKKIGVITNFFWQPMHKQSFPNLLFRKSMKNTNYFADRLLPLPSTPNLTKKNQLKIIKKINNSLA
jgi:predicted outer membrane repeat protein